jgi:hypothetical protein
MSVVRTASTHVTGESSTGNFPTLLSIVDHVKTVYVKSSNNPPPAPSFSQTTDSRVVASGM